MRPASISWMSCAPRFRTAISSSECIANQHGVGSSRAEGERLRDLPDAQGATLARKRLRLRVLSRLLLVTLVAAWGVVLLVL